MSLTEFDCYCFRQAISLANAAREAKNLPIGAVIVHERKIIGEGRNAIWFPDLSLSRHAEMEAMRSVPAEMWENAAELTLYTTLEPCLMCMGAILLHGIGKVYYGSADPYGGGSTVVKDLPPFFEKQFSKSVWVGPALPAECDPLYDRIKELESM